jgi:hypothetical protein
VSWAKLVQACAPIGDLALVSGPQDPKPSLRRCLLIFGFLGPPTGWLIAFLQLVLGRLEFSLRGIAELFVGFATTSVVGIPLSYVLGVLPATLTGLAYWGIRRHQNVAGSLFLTGAMGARVALLAAAIVLVGGSAYIDEELREWPYYLLPGAVAAITCGLLSDAGRSRTSATPRSPA